MSRRVRADHGLERFLGGREQPVHHRNATAVGQLRLVARTERTTSCGILKASPAPPTEAERAEPCWRPLPSSQCAHCFLSGRRARVAKPDQPQAGVAVPAPPPPVSLEGCSSRALMDRATLPPKPCNAPRWCVSSIR